MHLSLKVIIFMILIGSNFVSSFTDYLHISLSGVEVWNSNLWFICTFPGHAKLLNGFYWIDLKKSISHVSSASHYDIDTMFLIQEVAISPIMHYCRSLDSDMFVSLFFD